MGKSFINSSNLNVYPSSNASIKAYKVNSEKNLSNIDRGNTRNKIVKGLNLSINSTNLIIASGEAHIGGYKIDLKESVSESLTSYTSNGNYIVYLSLEREATGNENLIGDSSAMYSGLGVNIDTSVPSESDIDSYLDILVLGYVNVNGSTKTAYSSSRSKSSVRAQDVWVEGDTLPIPNNEGDHTTLTKNTSKPLDEYLASIIISDGQFN